MLCRRERTPDRHRRHGCTMNGHTCVLLRRERHITGQRKSGWSERMGIPSPYWSDGRLCNLSSVSPNVGSSIDAFSNYYCPKREQHIYYLHNLTSGGIWKRRSWSGGVNRFRRKRENKNSCCVLRTGHRAGHKTSHGTGHRTRHKTGRGTGHKTGRGAGKCVQTRPHLRSNRNGL